MQSDRWLAGDAYEAYMGRWSRRLARAFLDWLQPEPDAHWLDVGCGTGALTSAVYERCEPASIVGCDPSEAFIAHAQSHFTDPRITFMQGDVGDLPRRHGGFDYIVSGLSLNFMPDPARAIASMRERLSNGGVVAVYVWDYSEGMEFLRIFWDEVVALDPDARALDEGRRFPVCREDALASLFNAAGLARVETAALTVDTRFASFDDYWTPFQSGTGPAPGYVASLDQPGRAALEARLRQRLLAGSDGAIDLTARAWAVHGVRR